MTDKLSPAQLERLALDPEFAWLFDPEEVAMAAQRRTASLAHRAYLSVRQAADYIGVSYSHFRAKVQPEFPPKRFFGKFIYRRTELDRLIEQAAQWQRSTNAEIVSTFNGTTRRKGSNTVSPLDKFRKPRPK